MAAALSDRNLRRVRAGTNELEIRVANLWANRLNGDSLLPESRRFTRSNLDRIQTDPTSDSGYGRVPRGKTRPVYTQIPPLMKSGLFGPVQDDHTQRQIGGQEGLEIAGTMFSSIPPPADVQEIGAGKRLCRVVDDSDSATQNGTNSDAKW